MIERVILILVVFEVGFICLLMHNLLQETHYIANFIRNIDPTIEGYGDSLKSLNYKSEQLLRAIRGILPPDENILGTLKDIKDGQLHQIHEWHKKQGEIGPW